MSQDCPPVFRDLWGNFSVPYPGPHSTESHFCVGTCSLLLAAPAITGRGRGWVTSVLLPVQDWEVKDASLLKSRAGRRPQQHSTTESWVFIHSGRPGPQEVQTETSKELIFLQISGKISKTKPLSKKAPLDATTGRTNRQ